MFEEAIKVLKEIEILGFEAYIVGGYPRDKYLGIENKDIDICTNITKEILEQQFKIKKNNGYGSYTLENNIEITLYRNDIYEKNRFPKIVLVNTLEEDLIRRDFIMNTLCIDSEGRYIDQLGAIKDLQQKIIRTIKPAELSFEEDPLRIIRALRFKIDLGFHLSDEIITAIEKKKPLLQKISRQRIIKEIRKIKQNKKEIYQYIGDEYEE